MSHVNLLERLGSKWILSDRMLVIEQHDITLA